MKTTIRFISVLLVAFSGTVALAQEEADVAALDVVDQWVEVSPDLLMPLLVRAGHDQDFVELATAVSGSLEDMKACLKATRASVDRMDDSLEEEGFECDGPRRGEMHSFMRDGLDDEMRSNPKDSEKDVLETFLLFLDEQEKPDETWISYPAYWYSDWMFYEPNLKSFRKNLRIGRFEEGRLAILAHKKDGDGEKGKSSEMQVAVWVVEDIVNLVLNNEASASLADHHITVFQNSAETEKNPLSVRIRPKFQEHPWVKFFVD